MGTATNDDFACRGWEQLVRNQSVCRMVCEQLSSQSDDLRKVAGGELQVYYICAEHNEVEGNEVEGNARWLPRGHVFWILKSVLTALDFAFLQQNNEPEADCKEAAMPVS